MKLTTVFSAVNNNPVYYKFIPKQIIFWKKFNINFICVFIGESLPDELIEYKNHINLWSKNLDINTSYVAQNMRIYYPALLNLPNDELVMITDIDMLPTKNTYYITDLDKYTIDDFIYYRNVDGRQIYMCYNAAHPKTWAKVFDIKSEKDIEDKLYGNYNKDYNGIPDSIGWYTDQEILYRSLINYPNLKVLNRPLKRLEVYMYLNHIKNNDINFIYKYDDVHFHRNYFSNETLILDAERQLRT